MYNIYIDWANLHQWSKVRWWIDYQKLKKWLTDKFKAKNLYLFMWYIKWNEELYNYLISVWYKLIFKETLDINWKIKWNCDAELILQALSDYYENNSFHNIIISGDGDFSCIIAFYKKMKTNIKIIAPNKNNCSYLLKKQNIPIIYLEEQKHKIIKNAH